METKIIEEEKIWEEFLEMHPEANFLQSWCWGQFQESLDRKIFRTGFYDKNKLAGIMFSYVETSKRGKFLVVPGGPIIDWRNRSVVEEFTLQLKKLCKENSCVFARIRPQIIDSAQNRYLFSKIGFRKAPMYLHAELTSQLNIERSEDELLSNMRKATRYDIRKAQKIGITISDIYDEKWANMFIKLQDETAKRQKFVPFTKKFLLNQFDCFIKNGLAKLYTATFENKVLAQAFIIFYGNEAVYHYGASTDDGRHYPGAYLIQWEAIKEAKKRGMKRYNFWGVAPVESADHRFSGLSLFKRGFGGEDVAYLPAHDLVIDNKRYLINYLIEKTRRALRRV